MKEYKKIRWILLCIFIGLIFIALVLLLIDNKILESILITIGTIAVSIKIKLEFTLIGVQNNVLVKEQKNNVILKNTIETLETQKNDLIKNQEIIEAKYIEIKNVEKQIIYSNKLSSDDQLMKDIRDNLNEVEIDLRLNGLLNSFFNSTIFDNLCIFVSTLDSTMYEFVDKDLSKIFTRMKKNLKEFSHLYYNNVVRNDKTIMAQLKYTFMIQWKWKYNYTSKEFSEAEKDLKMINELLRRIVSNLEDLVSLYIEKTSPHSSDED